MTSQPDLAPFVRDLGVLQRRAMSAFLEIDFIQNRAAFVSATEDNDDSDKEAAAKAATLQAVEDEHEVQRQTGILTASVQELYDRLRLILELLTATETRSEMEKRFHPFTSDLAGFEEDEHGDTRCGSLDALAVYVSMLESLYPSTPSTEATYKLELLERVLKNTPKILADQGITPSKEATIYKAVGGVLANIFPDFTPSVALAKPLKNYKPDFGFAELGIAVEYKFATTVEEVKTALDGIFSDMQGYAGSAEWKTFYAVIYMTDHFVSPEQVESHTRVAEGRSNWRILAVYGKGAKVKKDKKDKSIGEKIPSEDTEDDEGHVSTPSPPKASA